MIAVAIFLTYGLQFYVPMEIIWKSVGHRFGAHKLAAEYVVRVLLVIGTGKCQLSSLPTLLQSVSFIFRASNYSVGKSVRIFFFFLLASLSCFIWVDG
jgi:hypothetical protein